MPHISSREQSLITSNKNININHKKIEKYRQTMYREKTRNRNTWKKETKKKKKNHKTEPPVEVGLKAWLPESDAKGGNGHGRSRRARWRSVSQRGSYRKQ
jgi:hypothetical protein